MNKIIFFPLICILTESIVNSLNSELNFVQNSNKLSLKLLNVLPKNENNFYSPLSITYSLYALLNGANGLTEAELRTLLEIESNEPLQSINNDIKKTLDLIRNKNINEVMLHFSNLISISNAFNLSQTYEKAIREDFNSSVESVDFGNNASNITEDINNWIKKQTKGMIPKLYESIPSDALLVLSNALYLSALWKQPFFKITNKGQFFGLKNTTTVDMMWNKKSYKFYEIPELNTTLIDLPFISESNLSMNILFPNEEEGLQKLISSLDIQTLNNALNELSKGKNWLSISLPKFQLKSDYDLIQYLSSLGLESIFTERADLSGISDSSKLMVSKAVHKAVIKVKESGVEAAAATGIIVNKISSVRPHITIDGPFLFLIRDNESGLVLFVGQVCDIEKSLD